jgi:hypothetical protein
MDNVDTVKNPLSPIESTNFLNTKEKSTIIKCAEIIREREYILKSTLRGIILGRPDTFERSIRYLLNLGVIKENVRLPPDAKMHRGRGKKSKYLHWVAFTPNDITESLKTIEEYEAIDLSRFPIRGIERCNETDKMILKKYLFRVLYRATKPKSLQIAKVFALLSETTGCHLQSLGKLYRIDSRTLYGIVKHLLDKNKIDIAYNYRKKIIEIFKADGWDDSHTNWTCWNCSKHNSYGNVFCGACGAPKNEQSSK